MIVIHTLLLIPIIDISCSTIIMYQAIKNAFYSNENESTPAYMHRDVKKVYEALPINLRERITQRKLKDFLQSQSWFTEQKKAVEKVKRNHYYVSHTNELWEMDLITLTNTFRKRSNNTFRYLLTVVDCFDRFGFVECLKSKRPIDVIKAFDKILKKSNRMPKYLSSDRGKEFVNKDFKSYLASKSIEQRLAFTTLPAKAAMVEIFNKTFQQKMLRWFSVNDMNQANKSKITNAEAFQSAIDTIVNIYNNTVHSSTNFKPADVKNENITTVYSNIHRKFKKKTRKWQLHIVSFLLAILCV